MSHSKEERIRNMDLAVRLMMEELGDDAFDKLIVETDSPTYQTIYGTTWQELENQYLVTLFRAIGSLRYRLTSHGWLKGLELLNKLDETKVEAGKIVKAIKDRMNNRQEISIDSEPIEQASGVSNDFLFNVIESDFIRIVLHRHSVEARQTFGTGKASFMFTVPSNFGQELL